MSKCYILGAGFSKAVSNLPIMRELSQRFHKIANEQDQAGNKNRHEWGMHIVSYIGMLETEFFIKPCVDIESGQKYENCNFQENLEALISFIDLNTSGGIYATIRDKDGNRSGYSKDTLFWNYSDLGQLKREIKTFLYLTLIKPEVDTRLLASFIKQLNPEDSIITFNYDLIMERALFERGLWYPRDGYGIKFDDFPEDNISVDDPTSIPLYKLHGSLNWGNPSLFNPPMKIDFFYDDGSPIFPGYLIDEKPDRFIPFRGAHDGHWMMPSYMKNFTNPLLLSIWKKAFSTIQTADEVVVVGYSLPKEDSAACLLFGTSDIKEKKMTLVDLNAQNLVPKYNEISGNTDIKVYKELSAYLS